MTITRVGLVADTHLHANARALPRALVAGLEGVARILHLGDWTAEAAVPLFEAIAPVDGVAGNNDPESLVTRFGWTRIVTVAGVSIGLTHGHLGRARQTPERAVEAFAHEHVDVVAYGHSHIPLVARVGDSWLVNPGSPIDKRRQPRYSYGILTIADGLVTPELFYYDDRRP